jgi:ATP-dependent DNA helicase RecQ
MPDAHQLLREVFGHDAFRDGQREIIEAVMAGGRVLAILPTGGGKSLTYQLPALVFGGLTLVVSPLLALMKDQVDALQRRGIPGARLDSSLTGGEQAAVLGAAESGALKLLYLSPERLANPATLARLKQLAISFFVVDEVHCYTEWGHSFRPDFLRLPGIVRRLKPRALLCLTATATPAAAREIRSAFGIKAGATITTPFERANISYQITPLQAGGRFPALLASLAQPAARPAIVYVIRQETAVDIAGRLAAAGIPAQAYHAGIDSAGREHVQQAFLGGQTQVIVATIAFGMGVDKADVRRVIHYNLPKSPEGWLQESGRAGRDGNPAVAEIFACAEDVAILENFASAWLPAAVAIERVLERIFSGDPVSVFDLSTTFDLRRETLEHLLVRLELDGWIRPCARTWKRARVAPLRPPATLCATLPKALRPAAALLLENPRAALDLTTLAAASKATLGQFHRVLDEWLAGGDAEVRRWHVLIEVRILKRPAAVRELAATYHGMLDKQAQAGLERLEAVVRLLTSRACLTRGLLAHFGQNAPATCGRCSTCRGQRPPRQLPGEAAQAPGAAELEAIRLLVRERHGPLRSAAQLARFLCGLPSPALARKRLERHACFGQLARLPFSAVLAYAEVALGR